jgi:hypothetical protein
MKDKNAWDVIKGEYGNPIKQMPDGSGQEINEFIESERGDIADNGLDQAEINNRKELRNVLLNLMEKSDIKPESGETVEQFIRRVEVDYYTQVAEDNISGKASVEVSEPDSTESVPSTERLQQFQVSLERNLNTLFSNWESVKNGNAWDALGHSDPEMQGYLKNLIERSGTVPSSNESLDSFVKSAESRVVGYDVPFSSPTEVDQALAQVFDFKEEGSLEEWIKMRDFNAQGVMNGLHDSTTDSDKIVYWRNMRSYLENLASDSNRNPNLGETLEQYIERANKPLKS